MAIKHPIPAFPDDIDRQHFASWLSGFCDGEANFYLGGSRNDRTLTVAKFALALRDDDGCVIRLIHSYFRVGFVNKKSTPSAARHGTKPQISYNVGAIHDLNDVLVPHFDRYPLFAKKRRDYAIWREAVILAARVVPRCRHQNTAGLRGYRRNWGAEDLASFRRLSDALREQRRYNAPEVPLVIPLPPPRLELSLFDAIG